jgi:hypothetical protein
MAGQYVQGQAAYSQAKYEQAAAKTNEALANEQAKNEIDRTKKTAAQRYRQASQLEGQQQAAMAANGIDINFGSAVDTLKDSKMIAGEDVGNIYQQGSENVRGYLIDAYNYKLKGKAAKSAAKGAQIGTGLNMLGTALGGASQVNRMKSQGFG